MAHTEMAYIAKNISGKKPYFAVATLHWTATMARKDLMSGIEDITWQEMKKQGWRIVKVKVSEMRG